MIRTKSSVNSSATARSTPAISQMTGTSPIVADIVYSRRAREPADRLNFHDR
jgi:hypothetical protein